MLKRLSFLISILVIIGFVIGIGWFIQYRNTSGTSPGPGEISSGENSLPSSPLISSSSAPTQVSTSIGVLPQKPFGLVADQTVAAYYPFPDGTIILIQPSGQIIKITGTEGTILSSLGISNLNYAAFSYDGKKIVATFGNPFNRQVSVFDIDRKSWEPVFARPSSNPMWAPKDYRLAFLGVNQEANVITLIDMAAKTPKTQDLMNINGKDLLLSWKGTNELFLSEKPSAFSASQLFSFDLKKKTITPILQDWPGLDFLWNVPIQEGVVFQANKNALGGKMNLIGSDGTIARQFSFTSLPSYKCFFEPPVSKSQGSSTTNLLEEPPRTLLCAIPKNTSRFLENTLPDNYLEREVMTEDSIIEIDLQTGNIRDLSETITEGVDATKLQATKTTVYFVNRYNQKLYRLSRS